MSHSVHVPQSPCPCLVTSKMARLQNFPQKIIWHVNYFSWHFSVYNTVVINIYLRFFHITTMKSNRIPWNFQDTWKSTAEASRWRFHCGGWEEIIAVGISQLIYFRAIQKTFINKNFPKMDQKFIWDEFPCPFWKILRLKSEDLYLVGYYGI